MQLPTTSPNFAILIALVALIILLALTLLFFLYRRRAHRIALHTLQCHHQRYRHLDTQTRLVTAAFKDSSLQHDAKLSPAELDLLSKAKRRDTEIWEVLGPSVESGKGAGPNGKVEIEKKLACREELEALLQELHKDILCRTFNSQPLNTTCPQNCTSKRPHVHAASITSITSTASATTVASYNSAASATTSASTMTTSTTSPLKLTDSTPSERILQQKGDQSDFYRQTRFDFEDRVRSPDVERGPQTWGGFDFGFGESGAVRASVLGDASVRASTYRRKEEEEETKTSWFEWVSMHLV